MEQILTTIKRPIYQNGDVISDIQSFIQKCADGEHISIKLFRQQDTSEQQEEQVQMNINEQAPMEVSKSYLIHVRQYMTKPATQGFEFQTTWNNNIPMPFRVMQAKVLKETRGMFYVECHAVPIETNTCMKCGRKLTHPVSRLYGLGPECGGHAHISPFESDQELYDALDEVRAKLEQVKWAGWVIKSAISQYKEV